MNINPTGKKNHSFILFRPAPTRHPGRRWPRLAAMALVTPTALVALAGCGEMAEYFRERKQDPVRQKNELEKKLQSWEEDLAEHEQEYQEKLNSVREAGRLAKKLAVGYTNMARYELAAREYHKAIALEAGAGQNGRDLVYYKKAISFYKKAFVYSRVDDDLLYQAGLVYANASYTMGWEAESLAVAFEIFSGLIRKNPQNSRAWYQRGVLNYRARRDFDAAIRDFKQVTRLAPREAPAWEALGKIYFGQRKLALAARHYRQAANIMEETLRKRKIDPGKFPKYRQVRQILETLETATGPGGNP